MSDEGRYYAKGDRVYREPNLKAKPDGTRTITMGFYVCTADSEAIAQHIAAALNATNADRIEIAYTSVDPIYPDERMAIITYKTKEEADAAIILVTP